MELWEIALLLYLVDLAIRHRPVGGCDKPVEELRLLRAKVQALADA